MRDSGMRVNRPWRTPCARTFRCADRRRRPVRHRRGLSSADEVPAARASSFSRAATASAAPGICFAIPASAPTATCSRSAIRSSRGPSRRRSPTGRASSIMSARPRPRTASTRRSASTIASSARRGRRRTRAGPWRPNAARARAQPRSCASPAISCSCAPAITNTKNGYTPEFPGAKDFAGRIVHPQKWTEDLDYAGKRVVVIGSGATAVTLVPEMAKTAGHVTMLQRSPTYVVARPAQDPLANQIARAAAGQTRLSSDPLAQRAVRHVFLPARAAQARTGQAADPRRRQDGARAGLRHRARISRRATIPGTSGCAWCPMATCSSRSGKSAPPSSPTRSTPSRKKASG